jgi:hypothetical protein
MVTLRRSRNCVQIRLEGPALTAENLYKKKVLAKKNVRTRADCTGTEEADIEDMFTRPFYLDVVNAEYASELREPISLTDLGQYPRILVNIEEHLKATPLTCSRLSR